MRRYLIQNMKLYFYISFLSALTCTLNGQVDTVFLDKDSKKCDRKDASSYRFISKKNKTFLVTDFYLSNKLKMTAVCTSTAPFTRDGLCTNYLENGGKLNEGNYISERKSGVWTWWVNNREDSLVGEFRKDGNVWVLNRGHYTELQSKKQFVVAEGMGQPTVVFLTGMADPQYYFLDVYPEIRKSTRIFAYDRSGLGNSEPINDARTVDTLAFDLHELLRKEKIYPPFVLVGHSMGGYIMRCFVSMYPAEVAGLIFIDPAVEVQFKRSKELRLGVDRTEFEKEYYSFLTATGRNQGFISEAKYMFDNDTSGYSTNGKIARNLRIPANIPVTLFASSQYDASVPYAKEDNEVRLDYFRNLKQSIPQIKLIETNKSGHYIYAMEPELVIAEIKRMVEELRTNSR